MNDKPCYVLKKGGRHYDEHGELTKVVLGFTGIELTFKRAAQRTDNQTCVKIVSRSDDRQIPEKHFKKMVAEAKSLLWPPKPKGAGL
jgi:hypothetical protein